MFEPGKVSRKDAKTQRKSVLTGQMETLAAW
jgi:hypothetical protein